MIIFRNQVTVDYLMYDLNTMTWKLAKFGIFVYTKNRAEVHAMIVQENIDVNIQIMEVMIEDSEVDIIGGKKLVFAEDAIKRFTKNILMKYIDIRQYTCYLIH